MKRHFWVILALVLAMGFYSCDNAKKVDHEQKSSIIVYGSGHCNHCKRFKAWLDEKGLKYTFHDVTLDQDAKKEMMRKVKKSNAGKRVLYPVVDLDGRILIRPAHKTVEALLKK